MKKKKITPNSTPFIEEKRGDYGVKDTDVSLTVIL